jgi:outer membrane protein TolC
MTILQSGQPGRLAGLLVAVLGWFLCQGATLAAQPKPDAQKETDKAAEIKKLLKQRRELLQAMVKVLTAQYQLGAIDPERVFRAERDLIKADTELADTPAERTAKLKESLKLAESFVDLIEKRVKVGGATQVDLLQGRAILLEVRIELLRDEPKAKPGKE